VGHARESKNRRKSLKVSIAHKGSFVALDYKSIVLSAKSASAVLKYDKVFRRKSFLTSLADGVR